MRVRKTRLAALLLLPALLLSACGGEAAPAASPSPTEAVQVTDAPVIAPAETAAPTPAPTETIAPAETEAPAPTPAETEAPVEESEKEEASLKLWIGEQEVEVLWEDNDSVRALAELAGTEGLTVALSGYGGFEQVGSLGTRLPRSDVQTVTGPGDIVLYSGNSIVLFYGSNAWAYTRLGKIQGLDEGELRQLLGGGDVSIRLALG